MSDQIHFYSELQQRIHEDLRIQHPDGSSPTAVAQLATPANPAWRSYSALAGDRRLFDCADHLAWAMPAMIEDRQG